MWVFHVGISTPWTLQDELVSYPLFFFFVAWSKCRITFLNKKTLGSSGCDTRPTTAHYLTHCHPGPFLIPLLLFGLPWPCGWYGLWLIMIHTPLWVCALLGEDVISASLYTKAVSQRMQPLVNFGTITATSWQNLFEVLCTTILSPSLRLWIASKSSSSPDFSW